MASVIPDISKSPAVARWHQAGWQEEEIRLLPGKLTNYSEDPAKAIGNMGRKLPDSEPSCTGGLGVVFKGGRNGG